MGCALGDPAAPSSDDPSQADLAEAPAATGGEEAAPALGNLLQGATSTAEPATAPPPAETPEVEEESSASAGPKPTQQCTVQKDAEGFFVRSSGKGDYVAYVPSSYSPDEPMRLVVGMHGCGDDAQNFARWGVNPFATRATQTHLGISVGSESGNNKCWSMGNDDAKVLAAIDDFAKCFWVDQRKVSIAGFSSGGQLAYRVGLMHASRFAGIMVENSSLYAAGSDPDQLLASAAWKINVAHRARTSDSVFPITRVKGDWSKTKAAGFPLSTSELPGGHDGSSADWVDFLLPQSASWTKP
jgi:predicted esterase